MLRKRQIIIENEECALRTGALLLSMATSVLARDCTRADGRRIEGSHRIGKWICRKDGQLLDNSLEIAHHVGSHSYNVGVPKCRHRGAEDGLVRIAFVCVIHGMEEA